ncbi:MAG: MBL fold metallo-hydrolase, partial [Thiolinea sp.]
GQATEVAGAEGIRVTAVALSSKAPPYSPHRNQPTPGDNVGLWIEDAATGRGVFYAPGLGEFEEHLKPYCAKADCLLVDGTCWTDDEMSRRGVGSKLASQMGHLAQSGPGGMLEQLQAFPQARRILIHINNTNPILDEQSPERAVLTGQGIEVAFDGMLIEV